MGGGFGFFLAERSAEIKKSLPAGSNVAKEAAVQWRALSEEEKRSYLQKGQAKMAEKDAQPASLPALPVLPHQRPTKRSGRGARVPQ